MTKPAVCLSAVFLALAPLASAQVIPIKTTPMGLGSQFEIFPSHNAGMGGVSIAVADTLLDPFRNPAKAARLTAPRFLGSPGVYSVSSGTGSGRTLPLALFTRSGSWFAGVSLAGQQVDRSHAAAASFPPPPVFAGDDVLTQPVAPATGSSDAGPYGNAYAFATLGRTITARGLSLATSVLWSTLKAVDGMDLLYPGSQGVAQYGHAVDVRLGVLKEWTGDRTFEAVALHNRVGMTDDVTYLDSFWDPGTQQFVQRQRVDQELDRSDTWGLHVAYVRPLAASGWRIGWIATANRATQPGVPNTVIMDTPRDRGHSSAYDFGVGVARTNGPATFGADLVYEPIWSHTWAAAPAAVVNALGDTIPVGGATMVNRFRFSNALFRLGVSRDLAVEGRPQGAALQLGLALRSIRYTLSQRDNVQLSDHTRREWWVEWTPTWGAALRFPEVEIRYAGRVTKGLERPGVPSGIAIATPTAQLPFGFFPTPSFPTSMTPVSLVMHQVTVSVPLR